MAEDVKSFEDWVDEDSGRDELSRATFDDWRDGLDADDPDKPGPADYEQWLRDHEDFAVLEDRWLKHLGEQQAGVEEKLDDPDLSTEERLDLEEEQDQITSAVERHGAPTEGVATSFGAEWTPEGIDAGEPDRVSLGDLHELLNLAPFSGLYPDDETLSPSALIERYGDTPVFFGETSLTDAQRLRKRQTMDFKREAQRFAGRDFTFGAAPIFGGAAKLTSELPETAFVETSETLSLRRASAFLAELDQLSLIRLQQNLALAMYYSPESIANNTIAWGDPYDPETQTAWRDFLVGSFQAPDLTASEFMQHRQNSQRPLFERTIVGTSTYDALRATVREEELTPDETIRQVTKAAWRLARGVNPDEATMQRMINGIWGQEIATAQGRIDAITAIENQAREQVENALWDQVDVPRGANVLIPVLNVGEDQLVDTFGAPRSGGRQHMGIDIMAPHGTPVVAATSGSVMIAGDSGGLGGIRVWIKDPQGNAHYYAHLESVAGWIGPGAKVAAGQVIGRVGNTGNARGGPAHLHYSVNTQGVSAESVRLGSVNPYSFLTGRDAQTVPGTWDNQAMPWNVEPPTGFGPGFETGHMRSGDATSRLYTYEGISPADYAAEQAEQGPEYEAQQLGLAYTQIMDLMRGE